jgi:peroxiredoxin Q/BCP
MAKKVKKKTKKAAKARKPKKMMARVRKKIAKKSARKAPRKAAPKRAPKPQMAPAQLTLPMETTPVLMEGMPAPDFRLKAYPEGEYSLSGLRGRKVVLYFYPKDDTTGCTKEACAFRDTKMEWEGTGAVVLGVSHDDLNSHQAFTRKYNLNFPLLADTDKSVSRAYGVYKEKEMYGKKFWGIERTTFLIDREGKIAKIFPRVQVDGHSTEVLGALKMM